jgi:hypothetical protein
LHGSGGAALFVRLGNKVTASGADLLARPGRLSFLAACRQAVDAAARILDVETSLFGKTADFRRETAARAVGGKILESGL